MVEVVIMITRTAEIVCPLTNIVTFDTYEAEAQHGGPTSITERKPAAVVHIEESNTFLKIKSAVVIFVDNLNSFGVRNLERPASLTESEYSWMLTFPSPLPSSVLKKLKTNCFWSLGNLA
ncbi:hypothetical protein Vadar_019009 [Vaccinium darrowii]|uniref:Uncharacterized protein n=1 Tax=Vaccinium darrowii TaxID=229202 RepID=A0ACB7YXJ3_9ERIC|nr:hypothetical protein Vadar_019009 [Vaccinium darrowii]